MYQHSYPNKMNNEPAHLPAGKTVEMKCEMRSMDGIFYYNPEGKESIQLFWNGQNIWDRQTKMYITTNGKTYTTVFVENIQELDKALEDAVDRWTTFRWTFTGKE